MAGSFSVARPEREPRVTAARRQQRAGRWGQEMGRRAFGNRGAAAAAAAVAAVMKRIAVMRQELSVDPVLHEREERNSV